MKVISGLAGGKKLKAPPGNNTRPITGMIKEALFSVWGSRIEGARVLDLFAGSGSIGIEALSRQAGEVIFIDNHQASIKTIYENIQNCGFSKGFQVYQRDVFISLDILNKKSAKFDLIYVDPPFTNEKIFDRIMPALDRADILVETGILVIRTAKKQQLPAELPKLKRYRCKSYGDSVLHYYHLREEDDPR